MHLEFRSISVKIKSSQVDRMDGRGIASEKVSVCLGGGVTGKGREERSRGVIDPSIVAAVFISAVFISLLLFFLGCCFYCC